MKSILVTGIGGVVGQGILRNIRAMGLECQIVGTNTTAVSAGNHLCDHVQKVPFADDDQYIEVMADLVRRFDCGLVVPSTDLEGFYLALNRARINATVAASPEHVSRMCLDKYLTFQEFSKCGIPFAKSYLPSGYDGRFSRTVLKPRSGRGSRNIFINPDDISGFDDSYVVQDYLDGPEITTSFYVLQNGSLHGSITLLRELEQGSTSRCETYFDHKDEIDHLLQEMVANFPFRGSNNVQCRITADGVIPFEVNCRISGTNSIRAQLGFPDVQYTIDELMLDKVPLPPTVKTGSAIRMMVDLIYEGIALDDIRDNGDNFRVY